jgi:hypothetical protein
MKCNNETPEVPSTPYTGIDYGLGQSNVDNKTGIRYGVISQHSVNPDALGDMEPEYGEPHCPKCGREIPSTDATSDAEWNDGKDYGCEDCQECFWSDECFPDEALGMSYDADGYKLTDCLDSDIFVLASPYFTYAQFCSPCVPGAGNLDTPMPEGEGAKCYALGPDWFDDDNPCPYPVYSVATGELVSDGSGADGAEVQS